MKILAKLYNTNKYDLNSVVIKKVELEVEKNYYRNSMVDLFYI